MFNKPLAKKTHKIKNCFRNNKKKSIFSLTDFNSTLKARPDTWTRLPNPGPWPKKYSPQSNQDQSKDSKKKTKPNYL
jgi:hypothetical protein